MAGSMRKPKGFEYECPGCTGRLEERRGSNTLQLVCIKCERIAGIGFLVANVAEPMDGQTTIEEFLHDDD